jgi:hypothetical protein
MTMLGMSMCGERCTAGFRRGQAKDNYPKDFSLQDLITDSRGLIIALALNTAKGGDPMSHGSAEGSVQFVREMKA